MSSSTKSELSCLHYSFEVLSKQYNFNYDMIFLELLGFKYNSMTSIIGDNLESYWINNYQKRFDLLKKYHGIILEIVKKDMVFKLLYEKETLIIYLDSFSCPWLPFYEKQHCLHSIVVQSDNNNLFFTDQYAKRQSINEQFVFENMIKAIRIKKIYNKASLQNEEALISGLKETILSYVTDNSINHYFMFLNDLNHKFTFVDEIDFNDPLTSKLVMHLKFLEEDRFNFTKSLEYINVNTRINLKEIIDTFLDISKIYKDIRYYLLKCVFSKKAIDNHYFYDCIKKAFFNEQEAILGMLELAKV